MLTSLPNPYRIIKAYSGSEAISRMEDQKPDLVFLDLVMPEVNGYEVLDWMEQEERLREVPVVIVSARDRIDKDLVFGNRISIHRKGRFSATTVIGLVQGIVDGLSSMGSDTLDTNARSDPENVEMRKVS